MSQNKSLSYAERLWWDYWESFGRFLHERNSPFKPTRGHKHLAATWGSGRSDCLLGTALKIRGQKISVFLNFKGPNAKAEFHAIYSQKSQIEKELGFPLTWNPSPQTKRSWLSIRRSVDVEDRSSWQGYHRWMLKTLTRFDKVFRWRLESLDLGVESPSPAKTWGDGNADILTGKEILSTDVALENEPNMDSSDLTPHPVTEPFFGDSDILPENGPLSSADVLERFASLNTWKRGDERAPHKPLLALYVLGQLAGGRERKFRFEEMQEPLTNLLREFGPNRKTDHPEFPFWHLQSDGVWLVDHSDSFQLKTGGSSPSKGELLRKQAMGGFIPDILATLEQDPGLAYQIAHTLLDGHFPESLHSDILSAVGLDLVVSERSVRRRDPNFRNVVLTAYEYQCAVCGLDLRLGNSVVALEAAHIKWHQAGGPDTVNNGLSLCVLHHKTFDLGAFTVEPDLNMLVSEQVHGSQGSTETLFDFHGRSIREPQRPDARPKDDFLAWHRKEVFKERPRHL